MPSESCYVTLMENAILLFVAYGILASYFEDVMHYGFLFFAVFIGLCACYASTAGAFCLMLLDDTTSTQLLLLDAERPFSTGPPNNIAHVARILARAATACSVALFLLFLTVGCEFFTEDSGPDSLPTIALKKNISESAFETQLAISTAFAVYLMLMLMLVGSNQQLNGLFLRLQYMTQSVPLQTEQAAAYATRSDDFALFVRALLGLYVVVCGCTGTFEAIFFIQSNAGLQTAIRGERRNYVALVLWAGWLFTDTLRFLLPTHWICTVVLTLADLLLVFLNGVLGEVLFRDSSLTNFACAVLLMVDSICVFCALVCGIVEVARTRKSTTNTIDTPSEPKTQSDLVFVPNVAAVSQPQVAPVSQPKANHGKTNEDPGLHFSAAHFNIDNIKMRVFQKKSN